MQQYNTLLKFPICEVMRLIPNSQNRRLTVNLAGFDLKIGTLRLVNFKQNGIVCEYCGREATHFELNTFVHDKEDIMSPHFNLFSNGVLMTQDHVIPKSKDGKDTLDNLVVACLICNSNKANEISHKWRNKNEENIHV